MKKGVSNKVTVVCKACEKEFQVKPYRYAQGGPFYCSRPCHINDIRVAEVKLTCAVCGKEFYRKRYEVFKTNYCSKECRDSIHDDFVPEVKNCEYCGKEFMSRKVKKGDMTQNNRFCGWDCFIGYREAHRKKEPDECKHFRDKIIMMANLIGNAPATTYSKVRRLKLQDEDLDRIVDPSVPLNERRDILYKNAKKETLQDVADNIWIPLMDHELGIA